MSPEHAHTILVLGGIKSGKSEFAEALAGTDAVRYVATAALSDGDDADPDWVARIEAHRRRRPSHWHTEDIGATPERLPSLIKEAEPSETLLIDDLGGWFTALLGPAGQGDPDAAGGGENPSVTAITTDLV